LLGLKGVDDQCKSLMESCETPNNPKGCFNAFLELFKQTGIGSDFASISDANPLVVNRFLQKIDWGKKSEIANKQLKWKYIQSWEKVKEIWEKNGRTYEAGAVNDKAKEFLVNCAKYVNIVYPQLPNPSTTDGLPKSNASEKSDQKQLHYPLDIKKYFGANISSLGMATQVAGRNHSIASVAFSPMTYGSIPMALTMNQDGGATDEYGFEISEPERPGNSGLRGFGRLHDYYETNIRNMKKAYESLNKQLHPDVDTKITDTLTAFKNAADEFTSTFNTVRKYVNNNQYVARDGVQTANLKDMEEFNKQLEEAQTKVTTTEVNLLKVISGMQGGLHKVYTNEMKKPSTLISSSYRD
jgi:hypothetical protein